MHLFDDVVRLIFFWWNSSLLMKWEPFYSLQTNSCGRRFSNCEITKYFEERKRQKRRRRFKYNNKTISMLLMMMAMAVTIPILIILEYARNTRCYGYHYRIYNNIIYCCSHLFRFHHLIRINVEIRCGLVKTDRFNGHVQTKNNALK